MEAIDPARAARWLGDRLCREKQFAAAAEVYRLGLRRSPDDPGLYYALGAALAAGGLPGEAKAAYREALRLRPEFPEVLLNLGNLLYDEGKFAEAALCYRTAIAVRPAYVKAWCNLGNALQMLGGLREATRCYERTLQLDPDSTAAQHNLGNAWMARRDYSRAEECFRRTVAMSDQRAEHHNSLGNALFQQRKTGLAEACYRRALELEPGYAAAHINLANSLMRYGQRAEMIAHYARALELDPKSAGGHYNLALALLREGRFVEGWREHEWRWDFRELKLHRRHGAKPQWRGEPIHGETILLHAEQGLGDTLQFVRYAPLVAERGATVLLEVQPRLVRLIQRLPGVQRVIARGDTPGEFSWQCPLMSLPLAFGTTADTIPRRASWIEADSGAEKDAWQQWPGAGLRVGVCWAGNPQYRSDEQRSMPLRALLPLADVAGISWFSLQMGPACGQMTPLANAFPLHDASSRCRDFAETAALVATLDVVISVDTSVAHLAGAMGKPLWLVLPQLADWRWMDHREDSPWYPTARLFRQQQCGNWSGPVENIREELKKLAASSEANAASLAVRLSREAAARLPDFWPPQARVTGCGVGSGPG
jgi:tetratricopeptide (TPR) repeat protein